MADTQDPVRAELTALYKKLEEMEKHELVALAATLTQTYVVEGLGTLTAATAEAAPARGADQVGDETFAGMLRRLKQARPGDEVLQKFIINGEHIQVRTPMGNVDVTEYRRPVAPASAPVAVGPGAARAAPSVPTNRDSIYNRELYQQNNAAPGNQGGSAAPAPAQNPAPTAQNAPRPQQPANQPPAKSEKTEEDKKTGQRIRMIELD